MTTSTSSDDAPDQRLHVACAADRRYVVHSAVMLRSVVLQAAPLDVIVHFLHEGVGRRSERRLTEMVEALGAEIRLHRVDGSRVRGLPTIERIPRAMWFRALLPELARDVGRILYLDVDVIAVAPLGPLWTTDLEGALVGAVSNVFERHVLDYPAKLGLPAGQDYFNSGVLLLDLDGLRATGAMTRLLDEAKRRGSALRLPDQDMLNLVLGGSRKALHPRFNAMNSIMAFDRAADVFGADAVEQARRAPVLRHFEGPSVNKPWHPDSDLASRTLYWSHRRETPWARHPRGRRSRPDRSRGDAQTFRARRPV